MFGSRRRATYWDYRKLLDSLTYLLCKHEGHTFTFVSGGCASGGDAFCVEIASELEIPVTTHLPQLKDDMEYHERVKAYYARNYLIAQDSDLLIALVSKDRTGGVENTIYYMDKVFKKPVVLL